MDRVRGQGALDGDGDRQTDDNASDESQFLQHFIITLHE